MAEPDAVLVALEEQLEELRALLAGLRPAQWALSSRCSGWSVSDVVAVLDLVRTWA